MSATTPLSVIEVDFRKRVALRVNELRHQEMELEAAITDIISPIREKRKQAFAKLNAARKAHRAGKQSTIFTKASKNRFETAVFSLDTSHWTMENPPRMATLKTPGSGMSKDMVPDAWGNRGFWIDTAPSYKALIGGSLEKLKARHVVAFGIELDAPWGLQFQDWGNPHLHMLLTVPRNADGTEKLAAFPTGKGARNAKYNGMRYWEWLESNWSDILKIRGDISSPSEHGVATWLPRADEVEAADSIDDYLGRFVGYMRLDNEPAGSKKLDQQKVPRQWRDPEKPQQVNFWGISGFTGKRNVADAPQRFEIHTKAALRAVIRYCAKISGQVRTAKHMNGVEVETSFWSPDRARLRGGMLDGPRTEEEVLELRRIISFFNKVTDPVEEMPSDSEAATLIELAAQTMAPAPWERYDFDVDAFIATLDAAESYDQDLREESGDAEDVRPLSELLELCGISADGEAVAAPDKEFLAVLGFSPEDQRKAERTARRKARKAERALIAASEDWEWEY